MKPVLLGPWPIERERPNPEQDVVLVRVLFPQERPSWMEPGTKMHWGFTMCSWSKFKSEMIAQGEAYQYEKILRDFAEFAGCEGQLAVLALAKKSWYRWVML